MSLLDIHVCLTYNAIAPLLGLEPTAHHTVSAKCPYCSAYAWSIYQDTKNMEEWHYCYHCKASGTVLSMAAEMLDLPLATAIKYIADQLHKTIDDKDKASYFRSLQFFDFCKETWQKAHSNMKALSYEQKKLFHRLKWHNPSPMALERYLQGPAQLYGILPRKEVLESFRQQFPRIEPYVAIVPFYKSPRQLSSFLCVTPQKELFYASPSRGYWAFDRGEHGFAGMQFLPEMQNAELIVTSMIHNMIQLQMHNFNNNSIPLSILGWQQPATPTKQEQWLSLSNREIVVWEKYPTAMAVQHAMMMNAKMAFIGPEMFEAKKQVKGEKWYKWIHHDPATEVVQRIVANAKPYEHAMKNWVRSAQEQEKTRLLEDACKFSNEVSDFVRDLIDPKLRLSIPKAINAPITMVKNKPNPTGHTVVIEKKGKWYGKKGNVRFPGIIRVSQIIVRPNKPKEYVGYVLADERKMDFKVLHNNASMRYFLDLMLSYGVYGQLEYMVNSFRDRKGESFDPIDVACRFEYPEVIVGLENIGWDGHGFMFKNFRIEKGRTITHSPYLFEDSVPGPKQKYCALEYYIREVFEKDTLCMELVWAFAIAIAMQLTCEVVGLETLCVHFLRNMPSPFIQNLIVKMEVEAGSHLEWVHKWPRYLSRPNIARLKTPDNFFVVDSNRKFNSAINIYAKDAYEQPRHISQSVDKIVINYLRQFTKQIPVNVESYEDLLRHTSSTMKQAFDFVPANIIDKAVARLSID